MAHHKADSSIEPQGGVSSANSTLTPWGSCVKSKKGSDCCPAEVCLQKGAPRLTLHPSSYSNCCKSDDRVLFFMPDARGCASPAVVRCMVFADTLFSVEDSPETRLVVAIVAVAFHSLWIFAGRILFLERVGYTHWKAPVVRCDQNLMKIDGYIRSKFASFPNRTNVAKHLQGSTPVRSKENRHCELHAPTAVRSLCKSEGFSARMTRSPAYYNRVHWARYEARRQTSSTNSFRNAVRQQVEQEWAQSTALPNPHRNPAGHSSSKGSMGGSKRFNTSRSSIF